MKDIERIDRKIKRKMIKSTVRVFVDVFPVKDVKVVDIGARIGYATKLLKNAGYDVIGTEIEPRYVDYAVKKGRNVIVDNFMNSKLPGNEFDIVFSRHVLEHCADTGKFFDECERILKPFGRVFITFPLEKKKTFSEKFNKKTGMTKAEHRVCYETIEEFRGVVDNTNFKIEYLDYSEKMGIVPMKREVLLIAEIDK